MPAMPSIRRPGRGARPVYHAGAVRPIYNFLPLATSMNKARIAFKGHGLMVVGDDAPPIVPPPPGQETDWLSGLATEAKGMLESLFKAEPTIAKDLAKWVQDVAKQGLDASKEFARDQVPLWQSIWDGAKKFLGIFFGGNLLEWGLLLLAAWGGWEAAKALGIIKLANGHRN